MFLLVILFNLNSVYAGEDAIIDDTPLSIVSTQTDDKLFKPYPFLIPIQDEAVKQINININFVDEDIDGNFFVCFLNIPGVADLFSKAEDPQTDSKNLLFSIVDPEQIDGILKQKSVTIYCLKPYKIILNEELESGTENESLNLFYSIDKNTADLTNANLVVTNEHLDDKLDVINESMSLNQGVFIGLMKLLIGLLIFIILFIILSVLFRYKKDGKTTDAFEKTLDKDKRAVLVAIEKSFGLINTSFKVKNDLVQNKLDGAIIMLAQSAKSKQTPEPAFIKQKSIEDLIGIYNRYLISDDKVYLEQIKEDYSFLDLDTVNGKFVVSPNFNRNLLFEINTQYYLLPVLPKQHPSSYQLYFKQIDIEGRANVYFNKIVKIEKPTLLRKVNNNTFEITEKGIMICSEV